MPGEIELQDEPADLVEAEARVHEACALLMRGDAQGVEEAGVQFERTIGILSGRHPSTGDLPRRMALHKSIQRAERLMAAAGRWVEHRRSVLLPDETAPTCYGANGKTVTAPTSGSMTLQG